MSFKDYYSILDVVSTATEQEIKQAYRRLVRMYHPDVNGGKREAEERFKDIGEAYHVLGNTERRKNYDQVRQQYQQWRDQPGNQRQGFDMYGFDIFGFNMFTNFFNAFFSSQKEREVTSRYQHHPPPQTGSDTRMTVEITLPEAWSGTEHIIDTGRCRLRVTIPPGVHDGTELLLEGQGNPGTMGGLPGNLYLIVKILHHPQFIREENDLYTELPVDIYTAILGGEVMVLTMNGFTSLTLPPETQADRVFCLKEHGMPVLHQPDTYGDMYIRIKLVFPESLSPTELKTLRKLALKHHMKKVS